MVLSDSGRGRWRENKMTFPAIQTNHAKNKTSQRSENMLSKRRSVNRANRDSSTCAPARVAVNLPSNSPRCALQIKIYGRLYGSCGHIKTLLYICSGCPVFTPLSCGRGNIFHTQWRGNELVPLWGSRALE